MDFSMLANAAKWLVPPLQPGQDEEAYQNSWLLSTMLIATSLVVILIIMLVFYFDPDDLTDTRTVVAFSVILCSLMAYAVNRMGYFTWAVWGFILYLSSVFILTPFVADSPEFGAFVVTAMLLAGMFLSFNYIVAYTAVVLVIVFILNEIIIDETIWARRILWYFTLFAGALILVFKRHLSRLETIRQRKLGEAHSQLRATLDALPDFLFELDRSGRILSYHMADATDLGVSLDEFVGQTVARAFPSATAQAIMGAIEEAAKSGKHTGTIFALDLPVGQRWFEVSIARKVGEDSGAGSERFVAVARNITERKQAEALEIERERLNIELEKERELTHLKEQLISIISHELRTPLSVISVTSSVLEKYRDRFTPEQQSERLHGILTQVKRLNEMLEQISTLSQAQRGFLQYEPQAVDVISLVDQVISEMQTHLQTGQKLDLKVKGTIGLVRLDQRLIWHVLVNLISNAIKYSPDGGVISLQVKRDNSYLVIHVQDEGIGIPEADLKGLFEPFHRASNVGGIGGTGLGLSIVKEIVDLHHGSISCDSKVGHGTTFDIQLPLAETA